MRLRSTAHILIKAPQNLHYRITISLLEKFPPPAVALIAEACAVVRESAGRAFLLSICGGVFTISAPASGEVTEWSIVPDSKSGVPKGTVGSNPTLSASFHIFPTRDSLGQVCSPLANCDDFAA